MSQQGVKKKKGCLGSCSNELNMSNYATAVKGLKLKSASHQLSISDPV